MTISKHFHTQFAVPVPCFNFHLVDWMSLDLPRSMYSTNFSRLQFALDLESLSIVHDWLYLLELPILTIASLQLMSCTESLFFTDVVIGSPTYYGICAKTSLHILQKSAPSHAKVQSHDLLESDHFPLNQPSLCFLTWAIDFASLNCLLFSQEQLVLTCSS